jgi:hypothetical protein
MGSKVPSEQAVLGGAFHLQHALYRSDRSGAFAAFDIMGFSERKPE